MQTDRQSGGSFTLRPSNCATYDPKEPLPPEFTAATSTTAELREEPGRPSADARTEKTGFVYTTECDSAIRKGDVLPLASAWMEPEGTVLSEVGPSEKDNSTISLVCGV